jgi:PTS system mannose-specific IIC component
MLGDLLPIALLGGVCGLDTVSFPQAMLARPLVAATLAGMLVGHPEHGVFAGAALELVALETLPVGASRYPEWGSAAVIGGAIFAAQATPHLGSLTVAVLGSLFIAWLGGWSMVKLRQRNAAWAARHRGGLEAGARGTVIGLQLAGLTADLLRGVLLTAAGYLVLAPLEPAVVARWSMSELSSRAVLVAVAAAVAFGAIWKMLHTTKATRWIFLVGLVVGLLSVAAA